METKIPTIEEVKAYFKNAKEVRSLFGDKFILENLSLIGLPKSKGADGVYYNDGRYQIYHKEKGYAEIISYKDEPLTVSKEFIIDLHKDVVWSTKAKIEKEFPQLFEVKLSEMTVAEIEAELGRKIKIVK